MVLPGTATARPLGTPRAATEVTVSATEVAPCATQAFRLRTTGDFNEDRATWNLPTN